MNINKNESEIYKLIEDLFDDLEKSGKADLPDEKPAQGPDSGKAVESILTMMGCGNEEAKTTGELVTKYARAVPEEYGDPVSYLMSGICGTMPLMVIDKEVAIDLDTVLGQSIFWAGAEYGRNNPK
jgi:hypothetical protein